MKEIQSNDISVKKRLMRLDRHVNVLTNKSIALVIKARMKFRI